MQKRQSGLQNEYSMHMALMHLTDKNSKAIDKGDYSLEIFIDFSDAFDAIIYQKNAQKMQFRGIGCIAKDWFI